VEHFNGFAVVVDRIADETMEPRQAFGVVVAVYAAHEVHGHAPHVRLYCAREHKRREEGGFFLAGHAVDGPFSWAHG